MIYVPSFPPIQDYCKHRGVITDKLKELLEAKEVSNTRLDDDGVSTEQSFSSEDPDVNVDLSHPDALFSSATTGQVDLVSRILDIGMAVDVTDADGCTPLHLAASAGHKAVVELLIDRGADVLARSGDGWTALRLALENGHHGVTRAIVQHGQARGVANAAMDVMQNTALHYAASYGDRDTVVILLQGGAAVDARNRFEQTPLHLAAWRRDLLLAKALLEAGADMDAEDFWSDTAFEVALASPVNVEEKTAITRMMMEHRQLQSPEALNAVSMEDAVQFLTMESVYSPDRSRNIFKAAAQGQSIIPLLSEQSDMNSLAEDLWEALCKPRAPES